MCMRGFFITRVEHVPSHSLALWMRPKHALAGLGKLGDACDRLSPGGDGRT
jgi:hypothetical protein